MMKKITEYKLTEDDIFVFSESGRMLPEKVKKAILEDIKFITTKQDKSECLSFSDAVKEMTDKEDGRS